MVFAIFAIPAHTTGTEGFGQPGDMVVLHIETGDDNIETVTVAPGYISDIEPSLLGCGVGGVEVDDAGVGTDTLAADIIVVAGGEGEVGGETRHHQDQPHHLSQSDSASQVSPPPEVDDDSCQLASFPPEVATHLTSLHRTGGKYKAAGRTEKCEKCLFLSSLERLSAEDIL